MLAIIILVAAGIGFYAFIGTAPKEAVQLMLFLFWGLLGLLTEKRVKPRPSGRGRKARSPSGLLNPPSVNQRP